MMTNKGNTTTWTLALASVCVLASVFLAGCGRQSPQPAQAPSGVENKTSKATSTAEDQSLTGIWESVDFVRKVEDFKPGQKSWQGDLFLKDFRAEAGGKTSLRGTWAEGWITDSNGRTRAQYFIRTIDGSRYLFLPWLSGDVIERGQQPSYYVMKASGDAPPPAQ